MGCRAKSPSASQARRNDPTGIAQPSPPKAPSATLAQCAEGQRGCQRCAGSPTHTSCIGTEDVNGLRGKFDGNCLANGDISLTRLVDHQRLP